MSTKTGNLMVWISHLITLKTLIDSGVIAHHHELGRMLGDIQKLVRARRKAGDGWVWTESEITKEERGYILPAADICSYLGLRSHHSLPDFFKKNGCNIKVQWDVESSCWYPAFLTKEDARATIKFVDAMFDKRYLSKD